MVSVVLAVWLSVRCLMLRVTRSSQRALAVVSEKTRNIIVFAVLTVVAVLLILFVVLRIRKRIKKKKEIDFEEE